MARQLALGLGPVPQRIVARSNPQCTRRFFGPGVPLMSKAHKPQWQAEAKLSPAILYRAFPVGGDEPTS